jgi:hypothetical protein
MDCYRNHTRNDLKRLNSPLDCIPKEPIFGPAELLRSFYPNLLVTPGPVALLRNVAESHGRFHW